MDILKPELMWINGICFRKNPIKDSSAEPFSEERGMILYTETEDKAAEEEEIKKDYNVEIIDGGRFRVTIHAPMASFSYLIGSKAATKKKIEIETKTTLSFPRIGQKGNIVVTGSNKSNVISACTRIEVLLSRFRQRSEFTHFLSLPLNDDNIKNSFLDFRDDVLRTCDGARGVSPSIFQNPEKLHLTIGVLVLLDDREREKAAQILQECENEIIQPILHDSPLTVSVEQIEYMNDDPAAVDVLYAKVKDDGDEKKLQRLADRLQDKFVASGFMRNDYSYVTLHITLMNTKFRKDDSGEIPEDRRSNQRPRESFDATNILKNYEKHVFGVCNIPYISISQMHSKDKDGYYKHSAKLLLPGNK